MGGGVQLKAYSDIRINEDAGVNLGRLVWDVVRHARPEDTTTTPHVRTRRCPGCKVTM